MSTTAGQASLLVELFTEELPPRALQRLAGAFANSITTQLTTFGLADASAATGRAVFCTPRRLAVLIPGVTARAPAREVEVKGPSVAVALDAQGEPTMIRVGASTCWFGAPRGR